MDPAIAHLIESADSFALIEQVDRTSADPHAAAELYGDVADDLYWERKDLLAAVAVLRAGIQHALVEGQRLLVEFPESGNRLRGKAKTLAFNLASFTWDGWAEEGIVVTPSELRIGRDAARLHARLAKELGRGPKVTANAEWMLGAHALSAGEREEAIAHFRRAAAVAEEQEFVLMASGFVVIAERRTELSVVVDQLRAMGTEEGEAYADQLEVAEGVFNPR